MKSFRGLFSLSNYARLETINSIPEGRALRGFVNPCSFTAESEREKRDWMEALQESIAETLSDYEVAEKIWSNRSNKICADCKAINPDWASINLCVVICKNCAGVCVCVTDVVV